MYAIYLPIVYWLARRQIGFRWNRRVSAAALLLLTATAAIGLAGAKSSIAGLATGALGTGLSLLYAFRRLKDLQVLGGIPGAIRAKLMRRGSES